MGWRHGLNGNPFRLVSEIAAVDCRSGPGNHTFPPRGVAWRSPLCQGEPSQPPLAQNQPEDVTYHDTPCTAAARTGPQLPGGHRIVSGVPSFMMILGSVACLAGRRR